MTPAEEENPPLPVQNSEHREGDAGSSSGPVDDLDLDQLFATVEFDDFIKEAVEVCLSRNMLKTIHGWPNMLSSIRQTRSCMSNLEMCIELGSKNWVAWKIATRLFVISPSLQS